MKKYFGLILGLSLTISSCASWYDTNVTQETTYQEPQQLDKDYVISGRFTIRTPEKNYYGNFNWQRESDNDSLAFMSPLGNTMAEIVTESGTATLTTGGNSYSGKNLDDLMQQQLGFTLPITYLHYWIQGIPLPGYPVQNRLNSGFNQLNWKIEYLSWQDPNHPKVIQVSKDTLRIKLLINWPESAIY